jgi:L-alanine-DL-glutamate epimerase-like enolase superfamily enzyme
VHLIERLEHKDPGSYRGRALAGLDTALWDMAGRRAGKPVTMCTMHLLVATPNAGKYLELSIEGDDYYPWQRDLFVGQPFTVTDGHVTVTDTPGWGVEISPAWLDRATYTDAALESFRPSAYGALYHKGGKP